MTLGRIDPLSGTLLSAEPLWTKLLRPQLSRRLMTSACDPLSDPASRADAIVFNLHERVAPAFELRKNLVLH